MLEEAIPDGSPLNDAGDLFSKAQGHHGAGRLAEAERCYRDALSLRPEFPEANNNLGSVFLRLGRFDEAEACFRRALSGRRKFPEAHFNLAIVLKRVGRLADAGESLRQTLALKPDLPEAHNDLGNVYRLLGRTGDAEACYRSALSLRPNYADAHRNLANLLAVGGRLQEAEIGLRKALALSADLPGAHGSLGWVLAELGKLEEAEQNYRMALELNPDDRTSSYNLSQVRLLLGDYATGLGLFEHRIEGGSAVHFEASRKLLDRLKGLPRWGGESIQRQGLLLWSEQGLGDTLMMMRYLPQLKQRGASRIVVICPEELVRLMQAVQGVDHAASGGVFSFDRLAYHCSFMSLPYLFRTRLDTIPREVPYLCVPPELDRQWAQRLAQVARPRCGLAWAGSANNAKDRTRSIPLQRFAALLQADNFSFLSLQKGPAADEIGGSGLRILDWMAECGDFLDTAALVKQLDLVISVDTAVAHLAGALGKPVWLLNRCESEWRWLLERDDSPWYPTMRIFRQETRGDWAGVIGKIEAAIRGRRLEAWE